jgi:hypothetical protein
MNAQWRVKSKEESSIMGSAGENCDEDDKVEEADMNKLFEDNGTNQCSISSL